MDSEYEDEFEEYYKEEFVRWYYGKKEYEDYYYDDDEINDYY
jgi:hypothetical protein